MAKTKAALEEAEDTKAANVSLNRKIELLEDELDTAEKNLKETVEKCVTVSLPSFPCLICVSDSDRWILRRSSSNVKCSVSNKSAMTGLGGTRYVLRPSSRFTSHPPQYRPADCVFHVQEMEAKHTKTKADLDELVANMEGL